MRLAPAEGAGRRGLVAPLGAVFCYCFQYAKVFASSYFEHIENILRQVSLLAEAFERSCIVALCQSLTVFVSDQTVVVIVWNGKPQ